MEYYATFGIEGGVYHGFGSKSPEYVEKEETFIAKNDKAALIEAAKLALNFSITYPISPETNYTTVTILALYDSERQLLDQKVVLKREGLAGIKKFVWDEQNRLVVKCPLLEHLL